MLETDGILQERYQLKQKLGDNPVRQTWLAEDLKNPEPDRSQVVVKLLPFGGPVQWDDLKLFEREAKMLKQLNHSRIPEYRDYFHVEASTLWFALVQEYIPGFSLKELQQRGKRFGEAEVRHIAAEILKILTYLHKLNPSVLHRDIKPGNLIVDNEERVYLIDFGAVQERSPREGASFTVVGTYGYTPMEQFGGRTVPASDLYALGATLIHLLTGTPPADLPQYEARLQFRHLTSASSSFLQWIDRLTEPSLSQRFASAAEAKYALESGIVSPTKRMAPASVNNSGQGGLFKPSVPVPDEIKGWNWGAFLFPQFWPLSNKVWIGLLTWVPYVGWAMALVLGFKGNEWAWKSRRWRSIQQFKDHQRGWTIAGLLFGIPLSLLLWTAIAALI